MSLSIFYLLWIKHSHFSHPNSRAPRPSIQPSIPFCKALLLRQSWLCAALWKLCSPSNDWGVPEHASTRKHFPEESAAIHVCGRKWGRKRKIFFEVVLMEEMEQKTPSLASPSCYAWTCRLSPQPEKWESKKTQAEKTQLEKISELKSSSFKWTKWE